MLIVVLILALVLLAVVCGFALRWLREWTDPDSRGERDLRRRLKEYLAEEDAAKEKIEKQAKESRFFWWKENHDKD